MSILSTPVMYSFYPTMQCDLHCGHCFIESELAHNPSRMSVEQTFMVIDKFAEHYAQSLATSAEITIMGGEPTLVPVDYYEQVIPYLREQFGKVQGKHGTYVTLMTNLLHAERFKAIRHYFDYINTSFEPSRFDTFNLLTHWIQQLQEWLAVEPNLVLSFTTTPDVLEKGTSLLDDFYQLGVRRFQINFYVPTGGVLERTLSAAQYQNSVTEHQQQWKTPKRERQTITVPETIRPNFTGEADFMIAATHWLREKHRANIDVSIAPLESLCFELGHSRVLSGIACSFTNSLNARFDGVTTGCCSEMGMKSSMSFGNLFRDSLDTILHSPVRQAAIDSNMALHARCRECRFVHYCKGGCQHRIRYWHPETDQDCPGLKKLLDHLSDCLC